MGLKDLFAAHAQGAHVDATAERHSVQVEGMHCSACEKLVSTALEDRGAKNVCASHETGLVEYEGTLSDDLVSEAIVSAGFKLA